MSSGLRLIALICGVAGLSAVPTPGGTRVGRARQDPSTSSSCGHYMSNPFDFPPCLISYQYLITSNPHTRVARLNSPAFDEILEIIVHRRARTSICCRGLIGGVLQVPHLAVIPRRDDRYARTPWKILWGYHVIQRRTTFSRLPHWWGKILVPTIFVLVLGAHLGKYTRHSVRFPGDPIVVAVHPMQIAWRCIYYSGTSFIRCTEDRMLRLLRSRKQGRQLTS